jgi:hypothetical protein
MCARHRPEWHHNPKPHITSDARTLMRAMDSKKPRQMDRRQRMEAILERDGDLCVWCSVQFDDRLNPATTEHLVPSIKGGPSWIENEVAACRRCNNERGHQGPAGWLQDCVGMGRTPRPEIVIAGLRRLQLAIEDRGGQRKSRPYIDTNLRRLVNAYPDPR